MASRHTRKARISAAIAHADRLASMPHGDVRRYWTKPFLCRCLLCKTAYSNYIKGRRPVRKLLTKTEKRENAAERERIARNEY